jgi:hypothetical protein
VALGGIAKIKGVSSRARLLISVKFLWVTLSPLVTMPGQCPPTILLKIKRNKELNGLGNNDICYKVQLTLYRGTHR